MCQQGAVNLCRIVSRSSGSVCAKCIQIEISGSLSRVENVSSSPGPRFHCPPISGDVHSQDPVCGWRVSGQLRLRRDLVLFQKWYEFLDWACKDTSESSYLQSEFSAAVVLCFRYHDSAIVNAMIHAWTVPAMKATPACTNS